MNETFGKILKAVLILSVVILAFLLTFGLVFALDWPWWVSIFIFIGFFGVFLGGLFIKKKLLSRREENFVQQIIAQEESSFDPGSKEKDKNNELKDRWNEAMHELKHSRLREYGNPLYVLPWYMVIGESGSGKTTAIESAGLNSQFAQINRVSGLSGTKNCDWWFFEEAIILDTAGRYAVPIDEGRDKDEWQTFLGHLVKYRKKEPINGLIVSVAVDQMQNLSSEDMEEYGNSIRKRIEELMLVLGATFPIHVMVTKCDLIKGMTEFCDALPEKSLNQAMGYLNNDASVGAIEFVERTISSVGDRLRDLRLILCQDPALKSKEAVAAAGKRSGLKYGVNPAFMLFPEEFESIKDKLKSFVKSAFLENRYQESAFLRGIYFSSGRQEGTPYSSFLKELKLIDKDNALAGTNKGLFLHDYFAKILPVERELYAPTQRAIELSKYTKNLWMASFIAIAIAICGLLSLSFMKNVRALNRISHEISDTSQLRGDLLSDVILLDRFRQMILDISEENRNWWIPRLGLNESKNVEDDLKKEYCRRFEEAFLGSLFTGKLNKRMTQFNSQTPEEVVGDHIAYLVRRINLLNAAIRGDEFELLQSAPQPDCTVLLHDTAPIPEVLEKLQSLYLYHLYWGRSHANLSKEVEPLQTWLKHLIAREDITLNWIAAWSNKTSGLPDIALKDFWGGAPVVSVEQIKSAYTKEGQAYINGFIKELETALPDPLIIAGKKMQFTAWYKKTYISAWTDFAAAFDAGKNNLNGKQEWLQTAIKMPTNQSPYFMFFDKIKTDLVPVMGQENSSFVALSNEFNTIRTQAEGIRKAQDQKGLASLSNKGRSILNKMRRVGLEEGESPALVLNEYQDALTDIASQVKSQALVFALSEKTFSGDPVTSDSPFYLAKNSVDILQTALRSGDGSDKTFWKLVYGPFDFLWEFSLRESECHLQEQWVNDVLAEVQGVTDQRTLNDLLIGKDGIAQKFIKGPAKAFITRDRTKGYQPNILFNKGVRFSDEVLSFYTKSERAPRVIMDMYTVNIKGLPTDVNNSAKLRPHETYLELQCANESQGIRNRNYPVRKTFKWSPDNCGDVSLKIEVGQLTLEKKYTGFYPFSEFLRHFSKGYVTFHPDDFPESRASLNRMGIKYITVKYEFSGHWPVIKLLDMASGKAPEVIAPCWESSN